MVQRESRHGQQRKKTKGGNHGKLGRVQQKQQSRQKQAMETRKVGNRGKGTERAATRQITIKALLNKVVRKQANVAYCASSIAAVSSRERASRDRQLLGLGMCKKERREREQ